MKYAYKKAPNPSQYSVLQGLASSAQDFKSQAKAVPCQAACPAKTDVPGYIEQISKGNFDAAYRINLEDNVFPAALGRICARPCEDECRHHWTNTRGSVRICHLKRASADQNKSPVEPLPAWYGSSGKSVAIVGGGPAGLAAARELRRYGHKVVIFEREAMLGGMMVYGIPRFRLPLGILQAEIDLIIRSGVEVLLNQNLDAAAIAKLEKEFNAVLIATGTTKAKLLGLEGELIPGSATPSTPQGLIHGLQFMADYNLEKVTKLQGNVVVIGGGFTAVDCARSCARAARRLLGEGGNVTIMYRRTEHHMAAELEEIDEIRAEQIGIHTLVSPLELILDQGKITGIKMVKNRIVAGKGKKGGIEAIKGSEFIEPCSHLIVAIGQDQDFAILPAGTTFIPGSQTLNRSNVFATGDFVSGSLDVIHAVADGKSVANSIDHYLTGKIRYKKQVSVELLSQELDGENGRVRSHDLLDAAPMSLLMLKDRIKAEAEVEQGFDAVGTAQNASRCYLCSSSFEIDADKCIMCGWCIDVSPRNCIKIISKAMPDDDGFTKEYIETADLDKATFVYIDTQNCIRCGKCLRVCPTEAISMKRATLLTEHKDIGST